MQLLGAWFEDIHFSSSTHTGTGSSIRSAYSRYSLSNISSPNRGLTSFAPSIDVWVSAQVYIVVGDTSSRYFGVTDASSPLDSGIFLGASSSVSKVTLYRAVNGVYAALASEPGNSVQTSARTNLVLRITGSNTLSSCRIRAYTGTAVDPIIDWSGDASMAGVSSLTAFVVGRSYGPNYFYVSECMATDEDPRAWGLKTLAPSGAGDTNTMSSGTYADVDEATLSDLDRVIASASGQEIDVAVTDLPAGAYAVAGVVSSMRVTDPDQTVPVAIGVRTGGTTYTDAVALPPTSWGLMQRIFNTNPNTSAAWTVSDINSLQLAVRS